MKIKCPNCKQIYHETTDKFDPTVLPTGDMVKLLGKYIRLKWSAFADGMQANNGTNYAGMRCPVCAASLCVKNRLVVVPEPDTPDTNIYECDICKNLFKTKHALKMHKRWKHA